MLSYFKRLWLWCRNAWKTADKNNTSEPQTLILVPEFDFRPTPAFRSFVGGEDARFVVANPVDLVMQHQGLMAEMLVIDVHTADKTCIMWMRYKSEELAQHGMAKCTLFVGYADQKFEGVCGQVRNRKRM